MKIYKVLQIGEHHTNHCEDYLVTAEVGKDKILCAVMDGCTMGEDSYFVSTLIGKLLRKIAAERSYQDFYASSQQNNSLEDELKEILRQLMLDLRQLKNQLLLQKEELLSTLVLLLYSKKNHEGRIIVIGDGVVCVDSQVTEYDQDNKPDYLGYHLAEDFDDWYSTLNQRLVCHNSSDISISTDGILTFTRINNRTHGPDIDAVEFLLKDKMYFENDTMLNRKLTILGREYSLKPTDDVGIIRMIIENERIKKDQEG